jgi:hypothetical protein
LCSPEQLKASSEQKRLVLHKNSSYLPEDNSPAGISTMLSSSLSLKSGKLVAGFHRASPSTTPDKSTFLISILVYQL